MTKKPLRQPDPRNPGMDRYGQNRLLASPTGNRAQRRMAARPTQTPPTSPTDPGLCGQGKTHPCDKVAGHSGPHHAIWDNEYLLRQGLPSRSEQFWDEKYLVGFHPLHPSWINPRQSP
jgi:hypothetical protein